MAIDTLDHFTIMTSDVDATAQFFIDALDFRAGPSPALDFPVRWVYTGDKATVHIVDRDYAGAEGTNHIDHIGFRATDYAGVLKRVTEYGAEIMEQTLPAIGLHQLFVKCPHSVWLELIFTLDDYRGAA